MITIPPTSADLKDGAALIGRLTAITVERLHDLGPSAALSLEVSDIVAGNLPQGAVRVVLVSYDTACETTAVSPSEAASMYTEGHEISVVAHWAKDLDGKAILFTRVGFGYASSVPALRPRTSSGDLDFQAFGATYENMNSAWNEDAGWRNAHRRWFEDFEYLRALKALRSSPRSQRRARLENLAHYSGWRRISQQLAVESFTVLVDRYSRRQKPQLLDYFRTTVF